MLRVLDIISLQKLARLKVRHLEDAAGFYFADHTENYARKRIAEERNKSFAMRHPVITGGIPAAIRNSQAKRRIMRDILSRDAKRYQAHKDYIQAKREYRKAVIQRQTKELKGEIKSKIRSGLLGNQVNQ